MQEKFGSDIYGFWVAVDRYDKQLWRQVQENWPDWFRSADVEVNCDVTINDTGLMKQF